MVVWDLPLEMYLSDTIWIEDFDLHQCYLSVASVHEALLLPSINWGVSPEQVIGNLDVDSIHLHLYIL